MLSTHLNVTVTSTVWQRAVYSNPHDPKACNHASPCLKFVISWIQSFEVVLGEVEADAQTQQGVTPTFPLENTRFGEQFGGGRH